MTEGVTANGRRGRFSPTILLIDDDKLVTKRWRREFHNKTSVGVVVANSLVAAADIVEANEVQIDAVVSDLIFDYNTDDPSRSLRTGVDFLSWLSAKTSDLPLFVMSATDSMVNFKNSLEDKSVRIAEYFDKFVAGEGTDPAWVKIQREILRRKFGEAAEGPIAGSDYHSDVELVSDAMSRLQLTVRTYIQEIPDYDRVKVTKPIEAICIAKDGGIRAYSPSLGLLASATGDTVSEAVDELAAAIGFETESHLSRYDRDSSEYVARVSARFREYLVLRQAGG